MQLHLLHYFLHTRYPLGSKVHASAGRGNEQDGLENYFMSDCLFKT